MQQRPSNNMTKFFVATLCILLLVAVFLFLAHALLTGTVDPLFLSMMIGLLLILFVVAVASYFVFGFLWFLLLYNNEQDKCYYWYKRREYDLEERKQAADARKNRLVHSGPHRAIRKIQVPSRRNTRRLDN